jgi:hypothetical protein
MELNIDLLKDLLKFANIYTFIIPSVNMSFIKEGSYNTNTRSRE